MAIHRLVCLLLALTGLVPVLTAASAVDPCEMSCCCIEQGLVPACPCEFEEQPEAPPEPERTRPLTSSTPVVDLLEDRPEIGVLSPFSASLGTPAPMAPIRSGAVRLMHCVRLL